MIQLSNKSSETFSHASIFAAIETAVPLAVNQVFVTAFCLFADVVELVLLLCFTIFLALNDSKMSVLLKIMLCCIPFVNLALGAIILKLRLPPQAIKLSASSAASSKLIEFLMECSRLRQTITTYRCGFKMSHGFTTLH